MADATDNITDEKNEAQNDTSQSQENPASNQTPNPQDGQTGGKNDSTGSPDWEKASEKYKKQRDDANKKVADLEKQIEDLKSKGDIEDYKKQLEEAKSEAEASAKKADKDRLNITRLAKEGCIDIDVALPLLDENGDVDALKEAKPYLFGAPKGSTGLKPEGSVGTEDEMRAKAAKAAGIPVEAMKK